MAFDLSDIQPKAQVRFEAVDAARLLGLTVLEEGQDPPADAVPGSVWLVVPAP